MHKKNYLIVKIKKDTSDFKKKTCFCKKRPDSFEKIYFFFDFFQKPHFLNPMHKKKYLIVKIKKDTSDFDLF